MNDMGIKEVTVFGNLDQYSFLHFKLLIAKLF